MSRAIALSAVATAAALVAGTASYVYYASANNPYSRCNSIAMMGKADIEAEFTLTATDGMLVTEKDVVDVPTLIYFGYTFCPDVCPLDVVRNVEAVDILKERGFRLKPVFISVDYLRDTPETVADYTDTISPDLVGLTGDQQQVRAAAQAFRYVFNIQDPNDEYTLINHMTLSYLLKPDEGFVAAFDRALSGEQLAEDLGCYLTAS